MNYIFNDQVYDEADFDNMSDKDLDELRLDAEKFARDQDLVIARGKLDYKNGGPGLSTPEFKTRKAAMAEALGLAAAIKSYIPPAR